MPSPPPRVSIPRTSALDLVLVTSRLQLRPLAETDVDDLWPTVSDPTFPQHMTWAPHKDKDETLAFIRAMTTALADGVSVTWAIVHEGRAVGTIGFGRIRWDFAATRIDRAEMGYWLARELHGKGLATEAARAVVQFGFDELGLHKITIGCLPDNAASRRVIEKVGFRFVGRQREDVWKDGRWHDQLRYELTVGDWSDVSTTMPISRPAPP